MASNLWRIVDAEVALSLDGDGVAIDLLTAKIVAENQDAITAMSADLARHAIAARIRRVLKASLSEASQPSFPGLERLPIAVCVPCQSGGNRYIAISKVKVSELRAAIEAQIKQVAFDIRRIRALRVFLNDAIAAGAADDDIVASRLSLAAE